MPTSNCAFVEDPLSPPDRGVGRRTWMAAALAALLVAQSATAAQPDLSMDELLDLPLEQLMDIPVTTVAGVEQGWFQSPAALYVLTSEDLRRTGHRTLADALRVVPGVFVGSANAHSWAVGMRGFSGGLANKTLVLIDGRAVYDPLFGGTFWDVQDVLLEDLDRIEVIRGPGATLWGANAVNGVINVITRKARDAQGVYVKAGGGTEELGFGSARYGGAISDKAHYRVWGKYVARDHSVISDGDDAHDEWDLGHGGFRLDYQPDPQTMVTLDGSGYDVDFDEVTALPVPNAHLTTVQRRGHGWANGGHFLARASRETERYGWSLQTYYDHTDRQQSAGFEVERNTADIDLRHHFRIGSRNELMWGLGYRYTTDTTHDGPQIVFDPRSQELETFSGFVQDTFTLLPDRVFAMIGSKLEHNSFTGVEVQPSGRLWWTPNDRNTIWASISRPVRVPTRTERSAFLLFGFADLGRVQEPPVPTGVFTPLIILGNDDLKSEKLLAYELGHRIRLSPRLTLDTALFYNDYSDLIFLPPTTFGTFTDEGSAETFGGELSAQWRALDRWTLDGSYSYVQVQIHGPVLPTDQGTAPHHQVKLRSYFNVTDDIELNTALYFIDQVPAVDADAYLRLDQGITWRATEEVELSLWGQNLLDADHREAARNFETERTMYVAVTFKF